MRIVIVANGRVTLPVKLEPQDVLIAADGGVRHCLTMGLHPSTVIGDLDSLEPEHLAILQATGAQIIQYPSRKDYTDLELALQYAQSQDASEIVILGALGERWDQTIANLLLAATLPGRLRLVDGNQEIQFLRGPAETILHGMPGDTVSLIPLAGDARRVSTKNLEYPLQQETLYLGSTRGVSNVLLKNQATVSLEEGLLVCTIIHSNVQ